MGGFIKSALFITSNFLVKKFAKKDLPVIETRISPN